MHDFQCEVISIWFDDVASERSYIMKKRSILCLIFALCMIFSTASPAFAAAPPSAEPLASGNGWTSSNIVKNGKDYLCTVGLGYSSSRGAFSSCTTEANCERTHYAVTMTYLAQGDGYITVKGTDFEAGTKVGTSNSYGAYPNSHYGAYQGFTRIAGSVLVETTNTNGTVNVYRFNPTLTNQV